MYGLGDHKFGHLTFIVLKEILVRDLYPDPDIVCQFLNGNQWQGVVGFRVPGAVSLLQPQTLLGGHLKLDPRFNSPGTLAKR